jgi:hypothetical protein
MFWVLLFLYIRIKTKMELKTEILKLRKNGFNYNEIKSKLNCSKSTISYHCDRNGMGGDYLKYSSFNLLNDVVEKVILLRRQKKTYEEIKNETKLSKDKISFICRINKIDDPNEYRKPSQEIIKEMQLYYNECKSSIKVAEEFGWSRSTILTYLDIKPYVKIDDVSLKKHKSKSVVDWRKRTKLKLVEYKGGSCEICGYNKCVGALSFHHTDPNEKDFTISAKSYSYERLRKEVDKCILVCNNCHIEIHEEIKTKL